MTRINKNQSAKFYVLRANREKALQARIHNKDVLESRPLQTFNAPTEIMGADKYAMIEEHPSINSTGLVTRPMSIISFDRRNSLAEVVSMNSDIGINSGEAIPVPSLIF